MDRRARFVGVTFGGLLAYATMRDRIDARFAIMLLAAMLSFDVLTGTTMTTECVVEGSCAAGIPLRFGGSTPARLFGFAFDLAVFLLPAVWLAALRSRAPGDRAVGRIGLLVSAALIGTALMASSPRWFGHRVGSGAARLWAGDRIGHVLRGG